MISQYEDNNTYRKADENERQKKPWLVSRW
jgi:hypothetical protein